jgi:Na+-transporting methylmalonyl-CoA/oxaloacetate decarboxylase gamma subunit
MIQEGLIIMFIGMLVVFLFLIVLVLLMQVLSKILILFPSAPTLQKDNIETTEHIAALYVLAHQYAKNQNITNNEVAK